MLPLVLAEKPVIACSAVYPCFNCRALDHQMLGESEGMLPQENTSNLISKGANGRGGE